MRREVRMCSRLHVPTSSGDGGLPSSRFSSLYARSGFFLPCISGLLPTGLLSRPVFPAMHTWIGSEIAEVSSRPVSQRWGARSQKLEGNDVWAILRLSVNWCSEVLWSE